MTSREKTFTFLGLGVGLVLAAVLYLATGSLRRAEAPMPAASSPAPTTSQDAARQGATPAGTTGPGAGEVASVELTREEQSSIGLQTAEVRRRELKQDVVAPGRVEEAETQLATISARIGGRIDKLYVSFTGQSVGRGQAIAVLYSPEVLSTAEEYKLALENRQRLSSSNSEQAIAQADEMVAASRRRLELWGVTPKQIAEIASSAQPDIHITIYSPTSGIVTERKVTEGQYVREGDVLYTLTDLSSVWVKADVYESDVRLVRVGQAVDISSDALPGATLHGRIGFIEPMLNPQTRTLAVRVQVPNPQLRLRPGMYANVAFHAGAPQMVLAVPRSAVLDTGTRKVVYVAKGNGVFEGRQVELGSTGQDYYPVLAGLKEGERVVTQGNFLIDSQTRLTGGMTGLFGGSKEFTRNGKAQAAPAAELKITLRSDSEPPKGGAENTFHVTVTDAGGKPVSDAQVKLTLVMPAMPSMGMGEARATADLAWNGSEYVGKTSIPLAGPYNTTVEVSRNGQALGVYRTRLNVR